MVSVRFQGKPFKIIVIQIYASTSNTEEAEVEQFYEDLQDLLELTQKRMPFHTVHGVLKPRILKWFAIPFSSGPHSVRPLHHDPPVLGGPTRHGLVSLS